MRHRNQVGRVSGLCIAGTGSPYRSSFVYAPDGAMYVNETYEPQSGTGSIWKRTPDGQMTSVYVGSHGSHQQNLKLDGLGNLYFAEKERTGDFSEVVIRKLSPSGTLTTVARVGATSGRWAATFDVDRAGNVYYPEQASSSSPEVFIRRVAPASRVCAASAIEICNGVDDDCDGEIDEGIPGIACGTGDQGACSVGVTACLAGQVVCNENTQPSAEICNRIDDDCNGLVDDGAVGCEGGTVVAAATGGSGHSLALASDGSVWAWGRNDHGQLGDGTGENRAAPGPVPGLTNVTTISTTGWSSMAVRSDGTAWGWGNNYGQLGDGTSTERHTPVQVLLADVAAVSHGSKHSLAVLSDGTVWSWGFNSIGGSLGLGTIAGNVRYSPQHVSSIADVIAVATGLDHSLALRSDGTVWAWGDNTAGQLGSGSLTGRSTPRQISGLTDVTAIAAGYFHSVALRSDGTVWAWGRNGEGQIGDGTQSQRTLPVQVSSLAGIVALEANGRHSLAVGSDGTAWAWGWNARGQLGDGTTTNRSTPIQVAGLTNVVGVAVGSVQSLALRSDGDLWAWGHNSTGELGDGTTTQRLLPVRTLGIDVPSGGGTTCATGLIGVCAEGMTAVDPSGAEVCYPTTQASPEGCNNLDDDCDGVVDEGLVGCAGFGGSTGYLPPAETIAGRSCSSGCIDANTPAADGVPATDVVIGRVKALTVHRGIVYYVSGREGYQDVLYRIAPDGIQERVAGAFALDAEGSDQPDPANGMAAVDAYFNVADSIAVGPRGIHLSACSASDWSRNSCRIYRIDANGIMSPYTGSGDRRRDQLPVAEFGAAFDLDMSEVSSWPGIRSTA